MTATQSSLWPRECLIALRELNVRELPGSKHNPRILEYHAATNGRAQDDETAWCSAFVNWCMMKAGKARTSRANARSWLDYGTELLGPELGCIAVLWRGEATSAQGHVGFYVAHDERFIYLLGGNQGNEVSIAAYEKGRILGFRKAS